MPTDNVVPKDSVDALFGYTTLGLETSLPLWHGFPKKFNNLVNYQHLWAIDLTLYVSDLTEALPATPAPLGSNKLFIPAARSQDFLYDENGLPK